MDDSIKNYKKVKEIINQVHTQSAIKTKTPPCLMIVSKGQTSESIERLIKAGHKCFGESRWQEIEEKWIALKGKYPDVRLDFIGNIQSNKLKKIMVACNSIQSVDKKETIEKIHRIHEEQKIPYPFVYIQVNIGSESQKSGVRVNALEDLIRQAKEYKIPVKGLMGILPQTTHTAPYFGFLWHLMKIHGLGEVSMGMSNDYQAAIHLGSSMVRIGRTIFE